MAAIEQNQVTLIAGETGCGKTTQVRSAALAVTAVAAAAAAAASSSSWQPLCSDHCPLSVLLHGQCHREAAQAP